MDQSKFLEFVKIKIKEWKTITTESKNYIISINNKLIELQYVDSPNFGVLSYCYIVQNKLEEKLQENIESNIYLITKTIKIYKDIYKMVQKELENYPFHLEYKEIETLFLKELITKELIEKELKNNLNENTIILYSHIWELNVYINEIESLIFY